MRSHHLSAMLLSVVVFPVSSACGEEAPSAGITRSLVAREPLLKNPVAVTVDVDGSIYVVETARRKAGDLDIRDFNQWIPATLGHRTVEERVALYEKMLPVGENNASNGLRDLNGDGVADFRDLTAISEQVHRLRDTNGDGMMDRVEVFAEDFATAATGVAAGVFAWRGDVYATIVPDLWKLRDSTGDGRADRREALLTGFGVHVAYAGHDMHGVMMGPDGRIYWTIGDKAANVVSREGVRHEDLLMGLLMRCEPDGSGYEVVARGLRNVQQIAFDDYGNIFGVDNDSDAGGEKERFLHIAEGSDSGWRKYYQYRGSDYNPWMAESMSVPQGPEQPAYLTPALSNYHDGPAGFARDPGTALNERYRGAFFMTAFPSGVLHSFKVEPVGASFRMTDSHEVDKGPAFVGCQFGPDGALYIADWGGGYALNEKGAVWKLDDSDVAGSELRLEVARMLREGPEKVADAELVARLKHPDQRIRSDAHLELCKRPSGVALLEKHAGEWRNDEPIACTHALWGLARAGKFSPDLFGKLVTASSEHTRAQAAKWAGECASSPVAGLVPLLKDPSAVVRYHAAMAVGRLGMTEALDAVLEMIASSPAEDAHLRHAGVMALAGMEMKAVKAGAFGHDSPAVRRVAAVVCRRAGYAGVAELLTDEDASVVSEAARAIYDDAAIDAAEPALAALLESAPHAGTAAMLRAIHANRRLADEASASRLSRFAADASRPREHRLAALRALLCWKDEIVLDAVDGRYRPCPAADVELARAAFSKVADTLREDPDKQIVETVAAVSNALGIFSDPARMVQDVLDGNLPDERRVQALAGLESSGAEDFEKAALALLEDASPVLRMNAAKALAKNGHPALAGYARRIAAEDGHLPERQAAISMLGADASPESGEVLRALLKKAASIPAIQLDVIKAAENHSALAPDVAALREKLSAADSLGAFLPALEGGDIARGRHVFGNHLAAQCTACHRLGDEGSQVGPPLTNIGLQTRRHILESIVEPQAEIAPGYGVMTLSLSDGGVVVGAPVSESETAYVVRLPDGKDVTVEKSKVANVVPAVTTMPAMGAILSMDELRDLVEFLASCRE